MTIPSFILSNSDDKGSLLSLLEMPPWSLRSAMIPWFTLPSWQTVKDSSCPMHSQLQCTYEKGSHVQGIQPCSPFPEQLAGMKDGCCLFLVLNSFNHVRTCISHVLVKAAYDASLIPCVQRWSLDSSYHLMSLLKPRLDFWIPWNPWFILLNSDEEQRTAGIKICCQWCGTVDSWGYVWWR